MPCARIATGAWAAGSEMKLIEAVQSALVDAFKIPAGDRDVVLDLYGENRRIVSAGQSERYTRVEIVGIAARSLEAERALFRTVADNLEAVGEPRKATRMFMIEPSAGTGRRGWSAGVRGGYGIQDQCVSLGPNESWVRRFLWRFSAAGMPVYPRAEAAGGRKAPRHEVAGGWAPVGQRALWGLYVGAELGGGCAAVGIRLADPHTCEIVSL